MLLASYCQYVKEVVLSFLMIGVEKTEFKTLTPTRGALSVITAQEAIDNLDLPSWFTESFFQQIRVNISKREESGFYTDPTSEEEVVGLVESTMGGNCHVRQVSDELNRFVVGLLQ